MNDLLLELSKNSTSRGLIKKLKVPLPLPPVLQRMIGPRRARELDGQQIAVYSPENSRVRKMIEETLLEAGGRCFFAGQELSKHVFHSIVFDATQVDSVEKLKKLHRSFHPIVRQISPCGRIVVIGNYPHDEESLEASASQRALEGFVRSLAKELGKRGTTVQLLKVQESAERRLPGPLRFFLSSASAYVTGQTLEIAHRSAPIEGEYQWEGQLQEKAILITGAAGGIGAETARIFAAEGAKVIILDRPESKEAGDALARQLGASSFYIDITHPSAPDKIDSYLRDNFGGVDVIVHNAGITRDKTLVNMPDEFWDVTLEVNLLALIRVSEKLIKKRTLHNDGRIICLSSIAGIAGNMGQTNYAASKAGVIGLVEALATQLAPEGITVNAVAPGFIETRMTEAIPFTIRQVGRRLNSLGQGGLPADVGQVICFLATPGAQGVTGQVLRVCGGSLLGA